MFRLKELRTDRKITQKELSSILGVSPALIGFYENEINHPAPNMLIKIADFFGCSVDYLLGREDDFGVIHSGNDGAKLRPDEERLLANFNNLIPPMQSYVLDMVEALNAQPQNTKKVN